MEIKFKPMKIYVELRLGNRAARDAVETKISNFIDNQEAGSTFRNQYREDSTDQSNPFWFRTELRVLVDAIGDFVPIRDAIVGNVDTFGEVVFFDYDFGEVKNNEVVDPEEPLDP